MVHPLLPASGLLAGLLPAASRLPGALIESFASLFSGPSETTDRDPDFSGDDALVAQIAVQDPSVRTALLREIDRRLSDDVPEDAETRVRLERLRDLLRRIDAAPAQEPPVPDPEPRPEAPAPQALAPATAVAPALPVSPDRIFVAASKAVEEPLRAAAAAAPAGATAVAPKAAPEAGGLADAELVDRVLRASRLAQTRGLSRLRLVLEPPDLGELRLDLTVKDHVVYGAFSTEVPGAAEALVSRLNELKDSLERRGLRVGELSVNAGGPEAAGPVFVNPFRTSPSRPGNLDLKA